MASSRAPRSKKRTESLSRVKHDSNKSQTSDDSSTITHRPSRSPRGAKSKGGGSKTSQKSKQRPPSKSPAGAKSPKSAKSAKSPRSRASSKSQKSPKSPKDTTNRDRGPRSRSNSRSRSRSRSRAGSRARPETMRKNRPKTPKSPKSPQTGKSRSKSRNHKAETPKKRPKTPNRGHKGTDSSINSGVTWKSSAAATAAYTPKKAAFFGDDNDNGNGNDNDNDNHGDDNDIDIDLNNGSNDNPFDDYDDEKTSGAGSSSVGTGGGGYGGGYGGLRAAGHLTGDSLLMLGSIDSAEIDLVGMSDGDIKLREKGKELIEYEREMYLHFKECINDREGNEENDIDLKISGMNINTKDFAKCMDELNQLRWDYNATATELDGSNSSNSSNSDNDSDNNNGSSSIGISSSTPRQMKAARKESLKKIKRMRAKLIFILIRNFVDYYILNQRNIPKFIMKESTFVKYFQNIVKKYYQCTDYADYIVITDERKTSGGGGKNKKNTEITETIKMKTFYDKYHTMLHKVKYNPNATYGSVDMRMLEMKDVEPGLLINQGIHKCKEMRIYWYSDYVSFDEETPIYLSFVQSGQSTS